MIKNDNPNKVTLHADGSTIVMYFVVPIILFIIFGVKDGYVTQGNVLSFIIFLLIFVYLFLWYRVVAVEADITEKTLFVKQVYAVFWKRPKTINLALYNIYYEKTTTRRSISYAIELNNADDSISISERMGYTEPELRDLYTKIYRLCLSAKSDAYINPND
jgi:hypothetical protein